MKRSLIIDGRQEKNKRVLEYLVTAAGWGYVMLFLIQIIMSVLLWLVGIQYLRQFIISAAYANLTILLILFTLAIALVVFTLAYGWSYYNKKKYGQLHRRIMPSSITPSELAELFHVPETLITELQTKSWMELEGEFEELDHHQMRW